MNTKITNMIKERETKNLEIAQIFSSLNDWNGYALQGNTFNLRKKTQQYVENELRERTKIAL